MIMSQTVFITYIYDRDRLNYREPNHMLRIFSVRYIYPEMELRNYSLQKELVFVSKSKHQEEKS